MTPLSPAAQTCLRQLRELIRELELVRGPHAEEAQVRIVRAIRDAANRFLTVTTH